MLIFAVLLDLNGQTAYTVIADQTDLRMKYGEGWFELDFKEGNRIGLVLSTNCFNVLLKICSVAT